MHKSLLYILSICFLLACKSSGKKHPDVSSIPVSITIERFDESFSKLDSGNFDAALNKLQIEYPSFLPSYLVRVLGIPMQDSLANKALQSFLKSYKPVFGYSNQMWQEHEKSFTEDLKLSLQLAKHYFPNKPLPNPFVVTTFVGPMDAYEPFSIGDYGDVATEDGAGIALQFHLGTQSSIYESGMQSGVLYNYQVQRFVPQTIVVNVVKNIVQEWFPYNSTGGALIEEMIEKGKRMYIVEKLLPNTADSLQMGYTAKQYDGCIENEALIWNYFVKSDILYSKEPTVNQLYIRDGPKTTELGEGAPGNIGLFVGRSIVSAYMKKFPETTMDALMELPYATILQTGGYNPK